MKIDKDFRELLENMMSKGTTIIEGDTCMCADCVARRKTGDIKEPQILKKLPKNATAKERQEYFEKLARLQAGFFGKDSLKEE